MTFRRLLIRSVSASKPVASQTIRILNSIKKPAYLAGFFFRSF